VLFISKRIFCVPCFLWFLLPFKMWELFLLYPVQVPRLFIPATEYLINFFSSSPFILVLYFVYCSSSLRLFMIIKIFEKTHQFHIACYLSFVRGLVIAVRAECKWLSVAFHSPIRWITFTTFWIIIMKWRLELIPGTRYKWVYTGVRVLWPLRSIRSSQFRSDVFSI